MAADHALDRREFLHLGSTALAAAGTGLVGMASAGGAAPASTTVATNGAAALDRPIYKALKLRMVKTDGSVMDKFKMLKAVGFDGVELHRPDRNSSGPALEEYIEASRQTGLMIPGVMNSVNWRKRLSDPDPTVREAGRKAVEEAIREAHQLRASTVLVVPGKVTDPEKENQQQVWDRSIEQIRKALPIAAKYGVRIAIENVRNGFNYDPKGDDDQTAEKFTQYIDEIDSPWVGMYYDIGNHARFADPARWIRTLGSRIVKLDVKGWQAGKRYVKITTGDVDWAAVRQALAEIGYTGWASAEIAGGGRDRMAEIAKNMDQALGI